MSWRPVLLLPLATVAAACPVWVTSSYEGFACLDDADCIDGWACDPAAGRCRAAGEVGPGLPLGDGDGDGSLGDGDGDPAPSDDDAGAEPGDGDGDGDGDGWGDPAPGDGDGDGGSAPGDGDGDGDPPFPDAGPVDAGPLPCADGATRCLVDELEVCTQGGWAPTASCPLGCAASGDACAEIVPSDPGTDLVALADTTVSLALTGDLILDTSAGTVDGVAHPDVQILPARDCAGFSVEVAYFPFAEIAIPAGVTLRIRGSRSALLASRGPVVIDGLIELKGGTTACAAGQVTCAGPGGFAGGSSVVPSAPGDGPGGGGRGSGIDFTDETGGGGGGHGDVGGGGGDESPGPLPGGTGGEAYDGTLALCGGSGGGGGGPGYGAGTQYAGDGGGGGGALHVFSLVSIDVGPAGGINAGGGGGASDGLSTYDDGAGGGGAGGTVVLEAPWVTLAIGSVVAANGGGGGAHTTGSPLLGGQDGQLGAARAAGGFGGGSGGAGADAAGETAPAYDDGTGGGGGAAGRIHLIALDGEVESLGVLSPAASRAPLALP